MTFSFVKIKTLEKVSKLIKTNFKGKVNPKK